MTWKSTAAASGLAVVGTWLASYAPVGGPREQPSVTPSVARTETAAAEIQREAQRLHQRLRQSTGYRSPARNPFEFGARRAHAPAFRPPSMTAENAVPGVDPPPPTLLIKLSGIAEDVVADGAGGETVVRTAIVSTPDDVHLVKTGDVIADTYKVGAIGPATVELVRLDNGSTIQLSFRHDRSQP